MKLSVPLHVSGFWVPYYGPTPQLTGSVGAGLILNPSFVAEIGGNNVILNGEVINFPHQRTILQVTGGLGGGIKATAPSMLGEGFGLSAALSLAISVSSISSLGIEPLLPDAGRIAHYAEILHMTGLGDVIAQLTGGELVVRVKPGPPGIGEAYPLREKTSGLVTVSGILKDFTTPQMLTELAPKIRSCGAEAMSMFLRDESLQNFIDVSRWFSTCTGMMNHEVVEKISEFLKPFMKAGSVLGFFVKKGLLVVISNREYSRTMVEGLKMSGVRKVNIFRIGGSGAKVMLK